MTFSQEIKVDGAIIISTPQEIALLDVKRGIKMFDKLKVKIVGLIDNMSYFESDDGKKYNIFGEGGVERVAKEFNKNFLGKIPINPDIGKTADNGKIVVALIDDHEAMLKRIRRKGKTVALESANRNYETKIFGPDRVKVQGVLVSLYRNF